MVRINLLQPRFLTDQHLIAEYNEILMLVGHVKKFPHLDNVAKNYGLGKGHITFFKNKLGYLRERHEELKEEMKRRGFKVNKELDLKKFGKEYFFSYVPSERDKKIIKKRLIEKINFKPDYYRYKGEKRSLDFFLKLIKNGV